MEEKPKKKKNEEGEEEEEEDEGEEALEAERPETDFQESNLRESNDDFSSSEEEPWN